MNRDMPAQDCNERFFGLRLPDLFLAAFSQNKAQYGVVPTRREQVQIGRTHNMTLPPQRRDRAPEPERQPGHMPLYQWRLAR